MIDDVRTWIGAVGGFLGIAGAVYAWLTTGSKANAEEIKILHQEHAELREMVGELRSDLKNRPRQGAVHELALKTETLAGEIKAMSEKVNAVASTTSRIDQYLRSQK